MFTRGCHLDPDTNLWHVAMCSILPGNPTTWSGMTLRESHTINKKQPSRCANRTLGTTILVHDTENLLYIGACTNFTRSHLGEWFSPSRHVRSPKQPTFRVERRAVLTLTLDLGLHQLIKASALFAEVDASTRCPLVGRVKFKGPLLLPTARIIHERLDKFHMRVHQVWRKGGCHDRNRAPRLD